MSTDHPRCWKCERLSAVAFLHRMAAVTEKHEGFDELGSDGKAAKDASIHALQGAANALEAGDHHMPLNFKEVQGQQPQCDPGCENAPAQEKPCCAAPSIDGTIEGGRLVETYCRVCGDRRRVP